MRNSEKYIIFMFVLAICISWLASCVHPFESVPVLLYRGKIRLDDNKAEIRFFDDDKNDFSLSLVWAEDLQGEYSKVGPLQLVELRKNGENVTIYPDIDLKRIEDIDFSSIKLYWISSNEYLLEMAWGVGENLSLPNRILLHVR